MRKLWISVCSTSVVVCAASFGASGQQLVADIRPQTATTSPGSYILDLAELSSVVLFGAFDVRRGPQMWRTDGTAAGTVPITSTPIDESFTFQLWTMPQRNGVLYFPAGFDAERELWRTDGTAAGTWRVLDINPTGSSSPRNFRLAGNLVYFTADDGTNGEELWRTDGTAAGTFMVADLDTGAFPHVFELTPLGNRLVFRATMDRELWITDGTTAGTQRLRDINPGPASSWPNGLVAWNGAVYFSADDGTNGYELWRSDGTAAGTILLADIAPGAAGSSPRNLVAAGSLLYFAAADGVRGIELWATDGTAAGTRLVRDIAQGATASNPSEMTALGARVVFAANGNDGAGVEPWVSDGTSAGTVRLADLEPGAGGSTPAKMRAFGGLCAFRATTAATGREVFVTDGTGPGTRVLRDLNPGPAHGVNEYNNFSFGVLGGRVIFPADDGVHGTEPWISSGTAASTAMILDVEDGGGAGSGVRFFGEIDDRHYMNANDGNGTAAWVTDGTPAGTVKAGLPQPFGSQLVRKGSLYYYLSQGASGTGLWSTDGTAAGTSLVQATSQSLFQAALLPARDRLVFVVGDGVWASDGTAAGTGLVRSFNRRPLFGLVPSSLVKLGDAVCFVAEDAGSIELWRTDGTAAGTQPLTRFGSLASQLTTLHAAGPRLYFAASDGATGVEPWVSDGTVAGTRMLVDIQPGPASSFPNEITPVAGGLYFVVRSQGRDLWFSDGTPAGTRFVASFGSGLLLGLHAFGRSVLFSHTDAAGLEPWISDGTAAGTRRILDVRPGPKGSTLGGGNHSFSIVGSGQVALFAAMDGPRGVEVWRTDGTAAGTRLVADLAPGNLSSSPRDFRLLGGKVLFAAVDPIAGEELHVMPLIVTGDSVAAPRGEGCAGTNGIPRLQGDGAPRIGNASFALVTTAALGNSVGVAKLGLPSLLRLGPCTLLATHIAALAFPTDATGRGVLPLPVPNVPALRGVEVATQSVVLDPRGAWTGRLSFSNGLLLVLGD